MDSQKIALPSLKILLKDSWNIFSQNIARLVGVFLMPALVALAGLLIPLISTSSSVNTGLTILLSLVVVIIVITSYLAAVYVVHEKKSVSEAYRAAFPQFISYLWISILSGLIVLGGLILGIIPGIIFVVWTMLMGYVLVIEKKQGLNAWFTGKEYVRGYWWPLLGRIILLLIILILFSAIIELILPGSEQILSFNGMVSALLNVLFTSFFVVYFYVLYKQFVVLKPNIATGPPREKGKGFFIFSAVLGLVSIITLIVAIPLIVTFIAENVDQASIDGFIQEYGDERSEFIQ